MAYVIMLSFQFINKTNNLTDDIPFLNYFRDVTINTYKYPERIHCSGCVSEAIICAYLSCPLVFRWPRILGLEKLIPPASTKYSDVNQPSV